MRRKTELDYNIITEDDRVLTCPEETKNHVAEYFKDLYQARPGTPEYDHWTQLITDTVQQATEKIPPTTTNQGSEPISEKEINKVIKKLKRKKSVGPDEIPNEIFIEGNKSVRNTLLKTYNRIHSTEEIPPPLAKGRNNPAVQRKREKRKMLQRKRNNTSKQYREGIRKNHQRKSQTACGHN